MATPRPLRRSVSPFGHASLEEVPSDFSELKQAFASTFGDPPEGRPHLLKSWEDAVYFPMLMEATAEAAANDAVYLDKLCQFALTHRIELEGKNLQQVVLQAFERIFYLKTEIFLSRQSGEGEAKETTVLFSRERNHLIGQYFFPVWEATPADFSGFIQRWISTDNLDRLLHFFDFSAGANSPTFEYYLVFSHSGLQRVVSNKTHLRQLWKKVEKLAEKTAGPNWIKRVTAGLDF